MNIQNIQIGDFYQRQDKIKTMLFEVLDKTDALEPNMVKVRIFHHTTRKQIGSPIWKDCRDHLFDTENKLKNDSSENEKTSKTSK
jgi:hypothetical protein